MRIFLAAVLTAVLCAPAQANFNAGVSQSFGTDDYEGTNFYAALGLGPVSIAPEYRRYSMKDTAGVVSSFSTRLGFDSRYFGIGATGGVTPRTKTSAYSNVYGGADVSVTLSPMGDKNIRRIGGPGRGGAPVGKGIARVDLGVGFLTTAHKQGSTNKLTQTEYNFFVGASLAKMLLLSGRGAKFVYNEKLNGRVSLPSTAWTPVVGHATYANAFPQASAHFLAEVPVFPMVRPFVDYTFTKYEPRSGGARPGDTKAYSFGIRVGLEMVAVDARYQHINTTGGAKDVNIASIGATLRL